MVCLKEKLEAVNQHVNIGGWTIVFPLRLPLFSQLSMINIITFRENCS